MPDKNELSKLIESTVEETLAKMRLDLTVALTTVAMATLDKAREISQHVIAESVAKGGA